MTDKQGIFTITYVPDKIALGPDGGGGAGHGTPPPPERPRQDYSDDEIIESFGVDEHYEGEKCHQCGKEKPYIAAMLSPDPYECANVCEDCLRLALRAFEIAKEQDNETK